jgi:hypothetical protein
VSVFNVFNFANFDISPSTLLSGLLNTCAASAQPCENSPALTVNSTTGALDQRTNRAGLGTGTFALGAPRQMEFGLKINF